MKLGSPGGDASDRLLMAMVSWRRGDKAKALDWYIQALEWLSRNPESDASLVELRAAEFVAHLLAHPAHHPRDTLWIILVQIAKIRRISQRVHPRFLTFRHREARHQPLHVGAPAMAADRFDLLTDTHRQDAGPALAANAFVFIDWHCR